MCKFLSAIVLKNGDILADPEHTDSHEDLIQAAGLRDDGREFARVEFAPPDDKDIPNPDAYVLRVDEKAIPPWFEEYRERVTDTLRRRIASMIITADAFKLGGCWIVKAGHLTVTSGRVTACDSSTVTAYNSSTVRAYNSSTVIAYNSSTVTAYNSSTVEACDSSTVTAYDSSTVEACDSSTVTAYDSSTVIAYDSSTVRAYDSSTVRAYDSSTVRAYDSFATIIDKRPK